MKLLVIDDHESVAQSIAMCLAPDDIQVDCALDGQSGLQIALSNHPDVILLDIGLPDSNGFEVCRALKQETSLRSIPVVFISGWGDQESRRKAAEAGGVSFVQKPFKMDELKQLVFSLSRSEK